MEVGDPSPIAEYENVSFLLEARGLRPLEHFPLVEDLEGVDAVRVLQLDHADLAECAAADHLQDLEVVLAQPKGLHAIGHRLDWKKQT
jgi:hypothetical protein